MCTAICLGTDSLSDGYVGLAMYYAKKERGTPNPVVDHHTASDPKWVLTAKISQLPAEAVGWGSPLGSYRPKT